MNKKKRGKRKRKSIFYIVVTLTVLALCFRFDKEIVSSISSLQGGFLNQTMVLISYLGVAVVIFVFATCLLLLHNRRKIMLLWLSFATTTALAVLLKVLIHRARPFTLGFSTLNLLIRSSYTTWNSSFPSFHAAIAFAALPFLKGKLRIFWFIFVCAVAFSRVFFSLHYASDVIVGAMIGYAISSAFAKIFKLKKGIIK